MLSFHDFNIQMVEQFFRLHPLSVGVFTYFICFAEAMAVIGAIIPGAIIMPVIGFLIGSAVIPVTNTFIWAILGALTGDCLSYLIGVYFQGRIHRMWPFTKWPNLLLQSERFFRNHGGKSVFIGRFVGPMRAMIPMIAGMLKMPFTRFFFVAIPSAVVWSIGYMLPGILLGALSLELPKKVAAEFTLGVFVTFVVLWIIVWFIKHFFKKIWQMIDYYIMQVWRYCQKHKRLSVISKFLSDPKEPDNHQQLTLLVMAAFMFILFLWVLYQVVTSGFLVDLSYAIYHLLTSLRLNSLDHIFVLITFFGELPLLIIASGTVFLWLLWRRQWYVASHWFSIVALSGIVVAGIKFFIYAPRPGDVLYGVSAQSFPSAHTALSVAFYGFLAVIIARELKTKKYLPYVFAGFLTTLIAFSRVYLGAHWLIDILGSILLGLVIVLLVTISYHRRHILHLRIREFIAVVISVFVATWIGYSAIEVGKQFEKYTLIWPKPEITLSNLVNEEGDDIPLYRLNRLGRPIEAFNVIYIGELQKLRRVLLAKGWEAQPTGYVFQNIIKSFFSTSVTSHLPIFPQIYRNQRTTLLFTKTTKRSDVVLILRLWPSGFDLKDSSLFLWIGTVKYHHAVPKLFSLERFKSNHLFEGATDALSSYLTLKDFNLWKRYYVIAQQPPEMRELRWDGKLLIIKSN